MPSVYIEENRNRKRITLSFGEYASIIYHDMFDYPLSFDEVARWSISEDYLFSKTTKEVSIKKVDYDSGYFFIGEDKQKIRKRLLRKKTSEDKLQIAYKAANLIGLLPSVLFVGITGSLAMDNADESADIDLIIITSQNTLWISRLFSLLILAFSGLKIRKKNEKDQKDRICANLWLTENNLQWKLKNIFTAHEIVQIKPLVNKNNVFEKFLKKNSWIYNFFPNGNKVSLGATKVKPSFGIYKRPLSLINRIMFYIQYAYMKNSITKEEVSLDRALFHPVPLSKYVENRFIQNYLSN